MIETFRRVGPALFRIRSGVENRAGRIAVLRGGTWTDRPVVAGDERHGVHVNTRFFTLVEIMNSPEAAAPQIR